MIILDTCVISEAIKPEPSAKVLSWIDALPESQVYIPSLVLGELQRGVLRLSSGRKRDALVLWLEHLEERFSGRWLPFDNESAGAWGRLLARLEQQGRKLPLMDSLIAALALQHQACLASRNVDDFTGTGIELVNPWD